MNKTKLKTQILTIVAEFEPATARFLVRRSNIKVTHEQSTLLCLDVFYDKYEYHCVSLRARIFQKPSLAF